MDEKFAGVDGQLVLRVDEGEFAGGELEGDGFAFAGSERHAFETDEAEFVGRHADDGLAEVELGYFRDRRAAGCNRRGGGGNVGGDDRTPGAGVPGVAERHAADRALGAVKLRSRWGHGGH